jgi:hypothetical protein
MFKKSLVAASLLTCLVMSPAQASLVFNFDYSQNTAGLGFLDATKGEERRASLDIAGNLFSELKLLPES